MARPKKPIGEQHDNRFAVYLTDRDSALVLAIADKKGIAPATLIRALAKSQLDAYTSKLVDDDILTRLAAH